MCIIWNALCPYVLDARLGLWVSLEHAFTCVAVWGEIADGMVYGEHLQLEPMTDIWKLKAFVVWNVKASKGGLS